MKTLVEMDDNRVTALDRLAQRRKTSRSALIREAVEALLKSSEVPNRDAAFGLWTDNPVDGVVYQDKLRSEW